MNTPSGLLHVVTSLCLAMVLFSTIHPCSGVMVTARCTPDGAYSVGPGVSAVGPRAVRCWPVLVSMSLMYWSRSRICLVRTPRKLSSAPRKRSMGPSTWRFCLLTRCSSAAYCEASRIVALRNSCDLMGLSSPDHGPLMTMYPGPSRILTCSSGPRLAQLLHMTQKVMNARISQQQPQQEPTVLLPSSSAILAAPRRRGGRRPARDLETCAATRGRRRRRRLSRGRA
mmetsp:Transcript_73668/g.190053  ORF Transcript_73668/g.190053 Transcript_73668/m.190053 type:complete len:227 (+) Transcript_73668:343-1023(+)